MKLGWLSIKITSDRWLSELCSPNRTPVMVRNCEILWRFFDSSSPHALHTSVATRCPVPGYLIEMQIVWWWHRRLVVVSPHCIPLICPSPHSEHAVPHHRWHTRCLGGALAPALACLHKDIPHPTPSPASLHTDPRFRIQAYLKSFLTIIYVLLYP